MNRVGASVTIGDLLKKVGLVSDAQLAQANSISTKTGAPLGSILVDTGILTLDLSRAALLAQSLVTENVLPLEVAALALKVVFEQSIGFEEALGTLGWRSEYYQVTNWLGQLLYKAGAVSENGIQAAVEASYASGLPLGRVLVLRKVIPESVAYAALTCQVLVRERKITQEQAVDALRTALCTRKSIEEALELEGYQQEKQRKSVRLGELLIVAGLVSEIDLLSAVEQGMLDNKPIGQVLLNLKLIDEATLDRALSLQGMINSQALTPFEAATVLQDLQNRTASDTQDLAIIEVPQGQKTPGLGEIPELLKVFGLYDEKDLLRAVQDLLLEKQNLAYRMISQQEEMKTRLARDLHDTVIADLMMLKRYLSGDKKLSEEQIIEMVDHVVRQIRDICSDFAPRHLKDWGLKMCLQDLLERMSQRTGIGVNLVCDANLPDMPDPVELHIFRIIQEGLNNVEKYSGASRVIAHIERVDEKTLRFTLMDNGKGFDQEKPEERPSNVGGMGMGGMKERADLIRCFYPTTLTVDSQPGGGSRVTLEVRIT
jgi:signal transduction histidine kinase